jgi:hypothetical protein
MNNIEEYKNKIKELEEELNNSISLDSLKKLFEYLLDNERVGSFRYLVYNVMKLNDYIDMYSTGLMRFKNEYYEMKRKAKRVDRETEMYNTIISTMNEPVDEEVIKKTKELFDSLEKEQHERKI